MNILMMTRKNLFKLSGGDKIQLEKTKQALERSGHTVTISNKFVRNLRSYDVVHLFNMQITPHSFMVYMLHANRQQIPVALSPIYWNPKQWHAHADDSKAKRSKRSMFSYRFSGVPLWRVLQYLLLSKELRHWLRLFIKNPLSGNASVYVKKFLLKRADIVLPNGQAELEQLITDFVKPKRAQIVPNGVDDDFRTATAKKFVEKYKVKDFVLSVGRLETRKNLVALAQATRKLNLQLVLIGNDTLEPKYVSLVKQAAGKLIIIPELPHQQLGSAYKAAKVHALVSWFETPGLSNLEAAAAGCNIVSTRIGTTKEYFGDMAWYVDPANQHSIEQAVKAAYQAPKSNALRLHVLTHFNWDKVSELITKAYETII